MQISLSPAFHDYFILHFYKEDTVALINLSEGQTEINSKSRKPVRVSLTPKLQYSLPKKTLNKKKFKIDLPFNGKKE